MADIVDTLNYAELKKRLEAVETENRQYLQSKIKDTCAFLALEDAILFIAQEACVDPKRVRAFIEEQKKRRLDEFLLTYETQKPAHAGELDTRGPDEFPAT